MYNMHQHQGLATTVFGSVAKCTLKRTAQEYTTRQRIPALTGNPLERKVCNPADLEKKESQFGMLLLNKNITLST